MAEPTGLALAFFLLWMSMIAFIALAIIYVYIINPDENKANATLEPCVYLFGLMYFSAWCYIMVFEVYYETDAAATQTQGLSRQDCATTDQPPVQCNTTNTPNDWQGCDAAVLPVAAGIRACGEIFSIAGVLVGLFGGGITGTGKGGFGVIMYTPATLCCGSEGARGRRTCCMTIGLVICSGIALLLWAMLLAIPCLVTGGLIGFLVFSSHGLRLISTVPAACVGFPQAQWEVFERVVNFTFCLNIPPLVAVGCGVVVACANGVARLVEKHNERNTPAWV